VPKFEKAGMRGKTMNDTDKQIALELKRRLAALAQIVDFRVFGSRARGIADEFSDLDVFIEVEVLEKDLKERILETAWEVGLDNRIVISPLIFTRNEIENTALRSSPIVQAIGEEGVCV
jgi:predicted nucleotidyltransferase